MALEQINDYGPGDNNFTSFQETLDATRRGMAEITLSNYDNDSAPVVKVGSVFENNGAFFQVTTSDITPTGYSGISNSTTFYLYFDESATAFIYSSTAPTWNDARQGWYNGDDRALFSMFKDSGGTLYQIKTALQKESFPNEITINTLKATKGISPQGYYSVTGVVKDGDLYSQFSGNLPKVGDAIILNGSAYSTYASGFYVYTFSKIERTSTTALEMYGIEYDYSTPTFSAPTISRGGVIACNSGGVNTVLSSIDVAY